MDLQRVCDRVHRGSIRDRSSAWVGHLASGSYLQIWSFLQVTSSTRCWVRIQKGLVGCCGLVVWPAGGTVRLPVMVHGLTKTHASTHRDTNPARLGDSKLWHWLSAVPREVISSLCGSPSLRESTIIPGVQSRGPGAPIPLPPPELATTHSQTARQHLCEAIPRHTRFVSSLRHFSA